MRLGGKLIKAVSLAVVATLAVGAAVWYYTEGNWHLKSGDAPQAKIVEKIVSEAYIKPRPLYVRFSAPVAKPSLLYQDLEAEIKIEPAVRGVWNWFTDTTLRFTPDIDFVPDTKYKVTLPKAIFSPKAKIKDTDFSFITPKFNARVMNSAFYEDPRDVHNKTAAASFEFNYPINPESVENTFNTMMRIYDFRNDK